MFSIAIWALAATFVLEAARTLLVDAQLDRLSRKIMSCEKDAAALKLQATRLNTPDTFASLAKLQRKAIAKEAEAARLKAEQDIIKGGWNLKAIRLGQTLVWLVAVVWLWGQPAVQIDPAFLWPFGRWFMQPHSTKFAGLGVITVLPWLSLSQRACHVIVRCFMTPAQ